MKDKLGINMVDLEETDQNYRIDSRLIDIRKLMQPALPPIRKRDFKKEDMMSRYKIYNLSKY